MGKKAAKAKGRRESWQGEHEAIIGIAQNSITNDDSHQKAGEQKSESRGT